MGDSEELSESKNNQNPNNKQSQQQQQQQQQRDERYLNLDQCPVIRPKELLQKRKSDPGQTINRIVVIQPSIESNNYEKSTDDDNEDNDGDDDDDDGDNDDDVKDENKDGNNSNENLLKECGNKTILQKRPRDFGSDYNNSSVCSGFNPNRKNSDNSNIDDINTPTSNEVSPRSERINSLCSRGLFSTRSLRYPAGSSGTTSGGSGAGGVGSGGSSSSSGCTTRKCVLTLDGYSYVIVASTPENKTRDDSSVFDRRSYDTNRSKTNSPTSSSSSNTQNICPVNGQVSKQGGLTIVRRSNSRKGNLSYQAVAQSPSGALEQSQQELIGTTSDSIPIDSNSSSSSTSNNNKILNRPSDTNPFTESSTTSNIATTSFISNQHQQQQPLIQQQPHLQQQYDNLLSNQYAISTPSSTTIVTTSIFTEMIRSNTATTPTTATSNVVAASSGSAGSVTTTASYGDINIDTIDLTTDQLPAVDTPDACDKAAVRLRCLLRLLQRGEISAEVLQKNLHYAARVLEAVFIDETKRLADEDDELSEVQPDAVPPEVREWLASTFTRQLATTKRRSDEKPKFRSVAHAIRAGIFVDRIYRRVSSSALMQFPPEVVKVLKNLDDWSFDVFALGEAANSQPVKYLGYDLLNRYGIIHKFKISPTVLETFLTRIEEGYCKFRNPYHNNLHAADVTQTTHYILCQTGLMNWLTDLEIFATLLAALIHDFEHTGTTNNFHVMSGSETAMLYNDRAVLENHHISAAFRVLKEDDSNVLSNLSREEYRELRTLVIDMVLSTDMSFHFQQLKNMKNLLTLDSPTVDKSKALALVLHCCDISHPAKKWTLHNRWTNLLLEEFFRQGDLERELGLPFSPLCDRNNTLVAESQIGFIDFIVDPSMSVCSDMLEYILGPIAPMRTGTTATNTDNSNVDSSNLKPPTTSISGTRCESIAETSTELNKNDSNTTTELGPDGKPKFRIKKPWAIMLGENKKIWKEQAKKDAEARANLLSEATSDDINSTEAENEVKN